MKNRVFLFSVIMLGLAVLLLVILYWMRRAEDPAVLLGWLEKNKGNQQELRMKLDMARGNVVDQLISTFEDKGKSSTFRAEVVDILLRQNLRASEPRIDSALVQALHDTSSLVRRHAVSGFKTYVNKSMKALLIPFLSDTDSEIRKIVYDILVQEWEDLSANDRAEAIKRGVAQRLEETDSVLIFYNRSLLGRAIALLCQEGVNAFQRINIREGDSLFSAATALDPENYRPAMILSTWHAQSGNLAEAVRVAKAAGILIEVPRLSSIPKIDGDPTDAAWTQAQLYDKACIGNRWTVLKSETKTKLYIGHAGDRIYCAVIVPEANPSKLPKTKTQHDSRVYDDDNVLFVFNPKHDDNMMRRFYKFIINTSGALYDRYANDAGLNFKCEYVVKAFDDRGYWAVEFAVNGKDLDNNPIKSGTVWNLTVIPSRVTTAKQRLYFWFDFNDYLMPLAVFQ